MVTTALGETDLLDYYGRIIRAVKIPVIVQDASGYVGRPMPVATQARVMEEFGADRVFFKPEAVPLGPNFLSFATRPVAAPVSSKAAAESRWSTISAGASPVRCPVPI